MARDWSTDLASAAHEARGDARYDYDDRPDPSDFKDIANDPDRNPVPQSLRPVRMTSW